MVHASTVVYVSSAVGHAAPYAYGYVDIPETTLRIFAKFGGDDPQAFQVGQAVVLHFELIHAKDMPAT